MPIVNRKSTLLPANARAADVAARTIETIMPIQQRRTEAAFRVQGIEAILYNQLTSGAPCSCKSAEKQLSILSPDGNAPEGIINRMISGREFDVTPYTSKPQKLDLETGFYAEVAPHDTASRPGPDLGTANVFDEFGPSVGDAGAYDPENLDDLINMFDASDVGYSDVSCPICFGTNYVGGYTPYRTWRKVMVPTEFVASETIDFTKTPWEQAPCRFSVEVTLPKGAVALDSFRVYRGKTHVKSPILIDGRLIASTLEVLSYCDGRPHTLVFEPRDPVTHIELQFSLSRESAFFEIPRLPRSGDRSMLEQTDPFQILMSPEVPQISSMDVIVESQTGKTLLVGTVSPWQTRNRSGLGWECQVRVIQPQELYSILPKQGKVYGQRALNLVPQTKFNISSGL